MAARITGSLTNLLQSGQDVVFLFLPLYVQEWPHFLHVIFLLNDESFVYVIIYLGMEGYCRNGELLMIGSIFSEIFASEEIHAYTEKWIIIDSLTIRHSLLLVTFLTLWIIMEPPALK